MGIPQRIFLVPRHRQPWQAVRRPEEGGQVVIAVPLRSHQQICRMKDQHPKAAGATAASAAAATAVSRPGCLVVRALRPSSPRLCQSKTGLSEPLVPFLKTKQTSQRCRQAVLQCPARIRFGRAGYSESPGSTGCLMMLVWVAGPKKSGSAAEAPASLAFLFYGFLVLRLERPDTSDQRHPFHQPMKNPVLHYRILCWLSCLICFGALAACFFLNQQLSEAQPLLATEQQRFRPLNPHELAKYRDRNFDFVIRNYGFEYEGRTGEESMIGSCSAAAGKKTWPSACGTISNGAETKRPC